VAEPRFHEAHSLGEDERDDEIDERDHRVGLEVQEGLAGELAPAAQQVGRGKDGHEGGVLQQRDEFVAHGRQNGAPGLGQNDQEHGLPGVEPEGPGGLGLALVDGGDARAEHLAHVGAVAEADGNHCGGDAADLHETRKRVVDVEYLHQQGDAAYHFHIGGGKQVDKPVV